MIREAGVCGGEKGVFELLSEALFFILCIETFLVLTNAFQGRLHVISQLERLYTPHF